MNKQLNVALIIGLLVGIIACQSPFKALAPLNFDEAKSLVGVYEGEYLNEKNQIVQFELIISYNDSYVYEKKERKTKGVNSTKGRLLFNKSGEYLALKSDQEVYVHYFKRQNSQLMMVDYQGKPIRQNEKTIVFTRLDFDQAIEGKYWKLIHLDNQEIQGSFSNEPHIKFIRENEAISGHTGCNSFGGRYTKTKDKYIQINSLQNTLKACEPDATEKRLLELLPNVDNYTIENDTLSLFTKDQQATMVFKAIYF